MEGDPRVTRGLIGQYQDMTTRKITGPRAKVGALHAGARLAIIGGRFEADNRAVFEAMHELSGGRIAVLPTASGRAARGRPGGTRLVPRATVSRARSCRSTRTTIGPRPTIPAIVRMLDRFGSFYFTGGDQALIVKALIQDGVPTPALAAIRRCWLAGGLVSGSSAGAAIMSDPMITSGGSVEALVHPPAPEPHDTRLSLGAGLGFFPYGLVDQHFLQRGRLGRLVAALLETGWTRGFGIDENTAMVISDGRLRVLGETGLLYVDVSRATGRRERVALAGSRSAISIAATASTSPRSRCSRGRPSGLCGRASATSARPAGSARRPSPATPRTRPWPGWSRATPASTAASAPGPTTMPPAPRSASS